MSVDVEVDTGYSRISGWRKPPAAEQQTINPTPASAPAPAAEQQNLNPTAPDAVPAAAPGKP
jgi:hypothetical protein